MSFHCGLIYISFIAGVYCDTQGLSSPIDACDQGFFCLGASTTSTPRDGIIGNECDVGYYCPQGTPNQLPCPGGQYCVSAGLDVPSGDCTQGFYCLSAASIPDPTDGVTGKSRVPI